MTLVTAELVTCAVCRHESRQSLLASSSAFGSYDLDLRPAAPLRHTMHTWVQACPHCRYVNNDIARLIAGAASVLESPEYLSIGLSEASPALAAIFERFALLIATEPLRAGQALLHAAWVCDDHGKEALAQTYRMESAEFLSSVDFDSMGEQGLRQQVVLVDIWRRAACYTESWELIERLRTLPGLTETMLTVLDFQEAHIHAQDGAAYTVEQAIERQRESGKFPETRGWMGRSRLRIS
jgi:hypothetical protein